MRSETKIFNEWYFKKYGGIISIGTMTGAVLKSWVRKGFDAGWNHRQTEVDELQKRVDSTLKVVQSMRNEVKHGHLSDDESQTLSSYANDLEQALKGGIK